jgi:ribonuclease HI
MIMWASGCTPDKWKESYTVLLYKNKGTILELDYYRRIGLENTLYKFWTKLVQGIFASYADKHNILSQEQGGFRAYRSTVHQLEIHTMLLEDARLMGQDIFTILVDLKEAFDTINHDKMYRILTDLGYPEDAVQVVKGLYENAFTQVVTPYGRTAPIRIQRGTLQGDSLSPFLFILYLEPLLRWLSVGARGYQPGALKKKNQMVTFSNGTYADDITLYAEGHSNLSLQAEKVSKYATWGGLIISQTKTIATAALYKRQPKKPLDKELVQRLLGGIEMQGRPIMTHDPKEPYKLLGVWFTMDLKWKKQYSEAVASLKGMAANLARCYNSQSQKLRTMQTCLKAKARYAFPLMCYSDKEIATIDKVMDSVVRQAYHLPRGAPTAMIREDVCRGGLGNTSLTVSYITTAVKNLTESLNEQGKRGQLTRALLSAQLIAYAHPSAASGAWVPDYSLRLRQLIQGTRAQVYQWKNGEAAYPLPNTETSQTILGNIEIWNKDQRLEQLKKPLKRLQEIGIFTLSQIVNKKALRLLSSRDIARNAGLKTLKGKYKKALQDIAMNLASQDYDRGRSAPTDRGYAIDQNYTRWLKQKVTAEQEYMPPPAKTLQEIYATVPPELLKQTTSSMVCGGKRERKLTYDPDIRQADPVSLATVIGQTRVDTPKQIAPDDFDEEDLELAQPEEHEYTLTRRDRAQKMLSRKVPAVTVYNMMCAYKDKVADVPGISQVVGKHTKWRKKARQTLVSQLQWKVQWAPTVLEGWEKELAIEKLGYKASFIRPATDADLQNIPLICEHCDQEGGVERCRHCRRGFHSTPCSEVATEDAHVGESTLIQEGICWECRRYDPELDDGDSYDMQVEPWYIEWEPKWENADTLKGLGYERVVNQTLQNHSAEGTSGSLPPKLPKDHHLSNRERQGNQGPRMHSTIGEESRRKCTFDTQDTDPHLDIVGTGRYELQEREVFRRFTLSDREKRDSTCTMISVHDPAGRTVGMLTPERVALLHHHYLHVTQSRREIVERLQPKPFAEEVAALLRRYKNGMPVPGTKRKVDLTNQWATPVGIYDMLQDQIPDLNQERFASPLNCHSYMQKYWSCFERDQIFGALHDAYKYRWTGFSVANPEYDSKEMYKAVSWAVHSAQNTKQPTLTVFVLPAWTDGSNTAYMKWVRKRPTTCRLLATIPKKCFKFVQPQATTLGSLPEDTGHPKWDINILLVGNQEGFETCFPNPESSSKTLKEALVRAVNQHAHPSIPLTWARLQHHWLAKPHPGPVEQPEGDNLDDKLYRPPTKVKGAPSDEDAPSLPVTRDLQSALQTTRDKNGLQNHIPLKYDWTEFAYTDGSQCKVEAGPNGRETVRLGSGVYVPQRGQAEEEHIGVQSTAPTRHNTAYRAELIAILAALQMGHNRILTDSVNSIHAIKAAIYYPAKIRFHRHKSLLEEIKVTILAMEDQVLLAKVRGHAGIPGNEYADDIANRVAKTGLADRDLSAVASNSRPNQVWPMQRVWEEDELSDTGLRERWQQVENLEDALTARISNAGDIRIGDANTTTVYYRAYQKSLEEMAKPYTDTWLTLNSITEPMKCTRAKYLTGQLPTAKNLQRYKVCKTSLCPCCRKYPDGGHHAVAWCPAIMGLVQDKHNTAVRIITKAIAHGDLGADSIVYNDGGSEPKWSQEGIAHLYKSAQDIPPSLLTPAQLQACKSRPDIILYRPRSTTRTPEGQLRIKAAAITLVEVKYTRDTDPSRTMRDPHAQHSRMHELLRSRHPTAIIERRNIILGVAGAIYTEATIRQLELLGVRGQHLRSTVHKLQRHAIQALHNIWRARQEKIRRGRTQQQSVDAPHDHTAVQQALQVLQDKRKATLAKAEMRQSRRADTLAHRPQMRRTILGGGVSMGGRLGGDDRDEGGGARGSKKKGEG